ncbi:MAG: DUF3800 domain-containing protein [Methanospirillum sp.]|nr:DUF3800 domain-containing protein [Methanospirillum sp.]
MPENGFSHIAFSDESHWNTGQYRGISTVTMLAHNYDPLNEELQGVIANAGTTEFGFKKLDEAKYRKLAEQMCEFAIRKVRTGDIRIDVLTWDTYDGRHEIRFRDDIRNFHIMYYQVFKNVFKNRWPDDATWLLCPDEQDQMDWENLGEYLNDASVESEIVRNRTECCEYSLELRRKFGILDIQPKQSHLEPFIQLADLFVGLGVYSREHYESIERWITCHNTQRTLFDLGEQEDPDTTFSRSHQQRCLLISSFNKKCKDNSLDVSLKTHRGFRTLDPNKPINFWWYIPQHGRDRAPTTKQQIF